MNRYICKIDLPEIPHIKFVKVTAVSAESAGKAVNAYIKFELGRSRETVIIENQTASIRASDWIPEHAEITSSGKLPNSCGGRPIPAGSGSSGPAVQ